MSQTPSPAIGSRYGVRRLCGVWDWPRSSFYAQRQRQQAEEPREPRRPGPQPEISDRELAKEIREVLKASLFVGEGYRKVWARLRAKKTSASLNDGCCV